MSHLGNDIFRESLREAKVEKIYDVVALPSRCFTSIDTSDRKKYKEELDWRAEHCMKPTTQKKETYPPVTLPSSTDEDYWMERQREADHLREVYYEAQLYRDL